MEGLGYCCGQKRTFTVPHLICYGGTDCRIERDQKYYRYYDESQRSAFTYYYLCVPHYNKIRAKKLNIGEAGNDV